MTELSRTAVKDGLVCTQSDRSVNSHSTLRSLIRDVQVSSLCFVTNIGITAGLHEFVGTSAELAYGVALVVVFLVSFVLLRYYVYDRAHTNSGRRQFQLFVVSSVVFRAGEYITFLAFHTWFGFHYLSTIITLSLLFSLVKHFFCKWCVFTPASEESIDVIVAPLRHTDTT